MVEEIVCPNCQSGFESSSSHAYADDKRTRCPSCAFVFKLGDGRVVDVPLQKSASRKVVKKQAGVDIAALFVSLLLPGLGHVIKSRPVDGVFWFVAFAACIVIPFMIQSESATLAGVAGACIVAFASAVSAFFSPS